MLTWKMPKKSDPIVFNKKYWLKDCFFKCKKKKSDFCLVEKNLDRGMCGGGICNPPPKKIKLDGLLILKFPLLVCWADYWDSVYCKCI